MKQKREKLMRALSYADEEYIAEAAPRGKKPKRKGIKWMLLAATLGCLLVVFNLWLFIPYDTSLPDVSMYADSPYYKVICTVNPITYAAPKYKNNFQTIWNAIMDELNPCDCAELEFSVHTSSSREITDNQEEGIIEPDLIKRSDEHVFFLNNDYLYVYSIEQESSRLVGQYEFETELYQPNYGFFLSEDCKRLTVMLHMRFEQETVVLQLDVSDPSNIKEIGRTSVSGDYMAARLIDGKILLFVEQNLRFNPDFSDESEFLPQITTAGGTRSIAGDAIVMPDHLYMDPIYTVVWKLDAQTLELCGEIAFLDYHDTPIYVSKDHFYILSKYSSVDNIAEDGSILKITDKTDFSCVSYTGNGLRCVGTVSLDGYATNQYSMDEENGVFRVVLTTSEFHARPSQEGESGRYVSLKYEEDSQNASLYCVDMKTWTVIASVEKFAPKDESVQSARFDGDTAYVCTAVNRTDPVFFFDLSDLSNITYQETDAIEGFSHSLVNFGNEKLVGLGEGEDGRHLKIEVYQEGDGKIESVAVYEKKDVSFSTKYKDYYIDRKHQLIGFASRMVEEDDWSYVLLHFDGFALYEVAVVEFEDEVSGAHSRSLYMDGYLYLFYADHFQVVAAPVS